MFRIFPVVSSAHSFHRNGFTTDFDSRLLHSIDFAGNLILIPNDILHNIFVTFIVNLKNVKREKRILHSK